MLTLHSRQVTDLQFDPRSGQFIGMAHLRYSLLCDPDFAGSARIRTCVTLPRWSRYGVIESALIQAATARLQVRLEEVETDPVNIFAVDPPPLTRAA